MAKVYLDSGDNFALSGAASVFGSTGTEKVVINTGVTGVVVDANVERVDLSGASSTYTFQQAGNQLKVFSGTTLVATIPLQDDANGTQVVFSNGSVEAKVGATGLTLGGATVPSAAAAAVTPTTIDATVTTGSGAAAGGTVTGQAFTLTSATTADVPRLTTGNDTVTGAAGTLNSNDVLADSSTTDSDILNAVLSVSLTTAPTISNVENINLDFKGFGLTFNAGSTSNGTIAVSSTQEGNTSATLQSVSATTKVVVGSGISTLSLASSGTTLNLTGGQSLTLNNGSATTNSGTLAFVSGGSSANTITYDANDSGATTLRSLSISGGQSLTIKTADLSDFNANTVTNTLSGTATLTLEATGTAAVTADLSKVAASSFNINATAASALSFATGAKVTLSKDFAGGTVAVGGTNSSSDSLNLTEKVAQTGVVVLSNFETVNVAVAATSALNIGTLSVSNTNAVTLNLTGSQDTTVTLNNASAAGTLNAADFGAKLTATILGAAGTIVGGASNDTIYGAASGDLLIGGAGNDTIFTGTSAAVVDTVIAGAGNDVINLGYVTTTAATTALTGAFSVNGGDGVDTLNVLLTAAGSHTMTGKVTNVEFVNVDATTATSALTWTTVDSDLAAGSTLTLNFTGAAAKGSLAFDGSAETDGSFNINASAVFTATAAAEMSSIKTGAGNDTITLTASAGAGTDGTLATVITGGKGIDTITLGTGASATLVFAAGDSGITAATADVVSGANAGDSLKFSSITLVQSNALATSAQLGTGWSVAASTGLATKTNATLDDFITAATASAKAGSTGMNGQLVGFVSGGDTYVFYAGTDTASNSDDGVIKLVGITADLIDGTGVTAGVFTLA